MIFTIESLFMLALERFHQWEIEEIMIRTSLDADVADYLSLDDARLIFQEEIMCEERKIWMDGEISLTQLDKDNDLKDRVWIQMNQLDLVVMKKATKEFVGC
jgi:hypothetical protein